MAKLTIVYWRDIPAQIIVRAGRRTAKRELDKRFIEAIDMCAMRTGMTGTDAYLEQWRRGDPADVGDDLEAEAQAALENLEKEYDRPRLLQLVNQGGFEHEA